MSYAAQLTPIIAISTGGNPWVISPDERATMERTFQNIGPLNGKLSGPIARTYFMKTGLPNPILGQIWQLSDMDHDGNLTLNEFCVAMHLVNNKLQKRIDPPSSLPDSLRNGGAGANGMTSPSPMMSGGMGGMGGGMNAMGGGMNNMGGGMSNYGGGMNIMGGGMQGGMGMGGGYGQGGMGGMGGGYGGSAGMGMESSGFGGAGGMGGGYTGSSYQAPKSSGGGGGSLKPIEHKMRLKYNQEFNKADAKKVGYVTGVQARQIFTREARLPAQQLAQIWNLADKDQDGNLNREEFAIAKHLMAAVAEGKSLPSKLPPFLGGKSVLDTTGKDGQVDERISNFKQGQDLLNKKKVLMAEQMEMDKQAFLQRDMEEKRKRDAKMAQQMAQEQAKQQHMLQQQQQQAQYMQQQQKEREAQMYAERAERVKRENMELEMRRELYLDREQALAEMNQLMMKKTQLDSQLSMANNKKQQMEQMIQRGQAAKQQAIAEKQQVQAQIQQHMTSFQQLEQRYNAEMANLKTKQDERNALSAQLIQIHNQSAKARGAIEGSKGKVDSVAQDLLQSINALQQSLDRNRLEISNRRLALQKQQDSLKYLQDELMDKRRRRGAVTSAMEEEERRKREVMERLQQQQREQEEAARVRREAERERERIAFERIEERKKQREENRNIYGSQPTRDTYTASPDYDDDDYGRDTYSNRNSGGKKTDGWGRVIASDSYDRDDYDNDSRNDTDSYRDDTYDNNYNSDDYGGYGQTDEAEDRRKQYSVRDEEVLAAFDYAGEKSDDLSFFEGDTITVTAKDPDGWWYGECAGFAGWFPSTYVEASAISTYSEDVLPPAPEESDQESDDTLSSAYAQPGAIHYALYNYDGEEESDLAFRGGDAITVLEANEDGWWKGELDGRVGYFPSNHVDPLPMSPEDVDALQAPPPMPDGNSRDNFDDYSNDNIYDDMPAPPPPMDEESESEPEPEPEPEPRIPTPPPAVESPPPQRKESAHGESSETAAEWVRAMHPYVGTNHDELTFQPGDVFSVSQKDSEGWWEGTLNGKTGWFPQAYVEPAGNGPSTPTAQETAPAAAADKATSNPFGAQEEVTPRPQKPMIAKVLEDYKAEDEGQLSLKKGALVSVTFQDDSGWWEGTISVKGKGKQSGWFPASYTMLMGKGNDRASKAQSVVEPAEKFATVMYDFEGGEEESLPVSAGDKIKILEQPEGEWWQGELNGKIGWVPAAFVEMIQ
ncbi:hypothetical protein SARC_00928 [Sphaeroforma arctica JP610]|uniref:Calmodulin n=1 Tax=Sphaeroforma arctica JP610 TaxID=667725 RepID=A0A0L0GDG5_9EUKA|nr:hypothetical protein SARC_00928 [Sphaeroforma arctica JP610]KNC86926.1 hypothetical protein SARC_00928 [Sphaeroforma arctica JP610]|eukprot:XP_014160828.1 hypothetical protein SARC_00928 [Sphaeroforma arctica JP610]